MAQFILSQVAYFYTRTLRRSPLTNGKAFRLGKAWVE